MNVPRSVHLGITTRRQSVGLHCCRRQSQEQLPQRSHRENPSSPYYRYSHQRTLPCSLSHGQTSNLRSFRLFIRSKHQLRAISSAPLIYSTPTSTSSSLQYPRNSPTPLFVHDFIRQTSTPRSVEAQLIESFINMPKTSKNTGYYAVQKGRKTGVFTSWTDCEAVVKGFNGAIFKKFATRNEAEAFVRANNGYATTTAIDTGLSDQSQQQQRKRRRIDQDQGSDHGKTTAIVNQNADVTSDSKHKPSGSTATTVSSKGRNKVFPRVDNDAAVEKIIVYCDGSSISNGQKSARAGWGVYFPDSKYSHLSESCRLGGPTQTNNRAELMALIRALQLAPNTPTTQLILFTDSQYSIKCVTEWLPGWKSRGWKTSTGSDVLNKDLIVTLDQQLRSRERSPKLEYVKGHAGIHGNEIVDRMAKFGASLPLPTSPPPVQTRHRPADEEEQKQEGDTDDIDPTSPHSKDKQHPLLDSSQSQSSSVVSSRPKPARPPVTESHLLQKELLDLTENDLALTPQELDALASS